MISWRGRLFQYSFTLRLAYCALFSFTLLPMDAVLSLPMPATFGLLLPPFEKVLWLRSYCRPQRFECIQFVFCGMVGTKGVESQPFSTLRWETKLWICISGDSRYTWLWSPLVVIWPPGWGDAGTEFPHLLDFEDWWGDCEAHVKDVSVGSWTKRFCRLGNCPLENEVRCYWSWVPRMTWIRTVPIGDCHERNFHLPHRICYTCSEVFDGLRWAPHWQDD